jgi:hypothetical protein
LVGARVSESHAEATQTKHPVCCLPQGFAETHDLQKIFADFELRDWHSAGDALSDDADNRLFLRTDASGQQPANLLLLDTPDVDGILSANHRRAELIRHTADVLVAVLTQQKYNDAVVRDFFREAARADKTLLIVFNMVHLPEQAETSRKWLETFETSTHSEPQAAYLAPYNYHAAEQLTLPFQPLTAQATNPREDLSQLQFAEIKLRSLRGSLQVVLDEEQGLPRYLQQCQQVSREYRDAYDLLANDVQAAIQVPQVPKELLMSEIWEWLNENRQPWERVVNQATSWPSRMIAKLWQRSPATNLEEYRRREWNAFQESLANYLTRLDGFRRGGNELIQRALASANLGANREQLFADLQTQYQGLPLLTDDFRKYVRQELEAFKANNPGILKTIKTAFNATAVIRPLMMIGLGYFGAHAIDLAGGHLLNLTGDVVVGATVAISGDQGLMSGMLLPARQLLERIFSHYYTERGALLAKMLHERVLGDSIIKLKQAAALPELPWWQELQRVVRELRVT